MKAENVFADIHAEDQGDCRGQRAPEKQTGALGPQPADEARTGGNADDRDEDVQRECGLSSRKTSSDGEGCRNSGIASAGQQRMPHPAGVVIVTSCRLAGVGSAAGIGYGACSSDALEGSIMAAEQIIRCPYTRRVQDRFRRLGWFALWFVAGHNLRLWLSEPAVAVPEARDVPSGKSLML